MVAVSALLALVLLQARQEPAPLGPTPPPDRYDDAYDARLFAAWGAACLVGGRDPDLEPQAPPLRPTTWQVLDGDGADPSVREQFLRGRLLSMGAGPTVDERFRLAAMPADGLLAGAFVCAYARVEAEADQARFLRAPGAELVFVNGDGFIGDPDKRGWLGVPVALRKGINDVLAVGIRDGFELELWKPVTRVVIGSWAVAATDEGRPWPDRADHLFVPLFNASIQTADSIHLHYDRVAEQGTLPAVEEWNDGLYAGPLGLGLGVSYVFDLSQEVPVGANLWAPLVVYADGDEHAERRLHVLPAGAPRPRWPAPTPACWPPTTSPITLVVEPCGNDAFDAEALAVARFCQLRLWERSGTFAPVFAAAYYEAHLDRSDPREPLTPLGRAHVVRFGRLDLDGSVLRAGPETNSSGAAHSIRASDSVAMRLVYAVEPFFHAIGSAGESWTVP